MMRSIVFIAGYTEFITGEFLTAAFPGSRIVMTGCCAIKGSAFEKVSRFQGTLTASACRELFHTYEFSQVVYFPQGLVPLGQMPGEELDILSNLISASVPETRLVYVSGPEHLSPSPLQPREAALREVCRRLAAKTGGIQFLVSPWIYLVEQPASSLAELFHPGLHRLDLPAGQEIRFLAAEDLAILLHRVFEDWDPASDPFYLPAGTQCTLKTLTDWIRETAGKKCPEFQFSGTAPEALHSGDALRLHCRYLWFPVYSLEQDLEALANVARKESVRKHPTFPTGLPVKILELLAAGALCEMLLRLSNAATQFRMVDFRLMTIVVLGSMYNISMGIAAALMESISLMHDYSRSGTSWLTLFHEPTNWLPFISFFTVGAVCGYLRSRDQSQLKFIQEENQSLKERYAYLQKLNDDVLREKQEYKQQIISSRDSFGKLFHIAQQLNRNHPRPLLSKAVDVLETMMGSSSAAIYQCSSTLPYGRLEVSSRGSNMPCALDVRRFYAHLESLSDGEPWVNRALEPDMPQYLFGIRRGEEIILMIMIQKTDFNQMSLYYENIFRIVCGLISIALVRALEYQDAVWLRRCVAGSQRILRQESFLEELDYAIDADEQKHAVHLLVRLDADGPLDILEPRIVKCIRAEDRIGIIGSRLYILLLQAQPSDMALIGRRLDAEGLPCTPVSPEQQRELLGKECAV